jgi:hypothetical protein
MLYQILDAKALDPVQSLRMAGRLGSALVIDKNRNGRAYIKPFFAQAYNPLPMISAHLHRSCEWWIHYLSCNPEYVIDPLSSGRPTIRLWTDASGVSRWLCGVLHTRCGWLWTSMQLPQLVWDQLLDREDHQIQYQEFLAIVLAVETFDIADAMILGFVDNNSVLAAIPKGSSRNPEVALGIAKLWETFTSRNVAWFGIRVASKSNVADGPTRNDFAYMDLLKAKFVAPKLPAWTTDI